MVEELAGDCIYCAHFCTSCCVFIAQFFKIVLENVNDFVRLELALNSRSDFINEFVKFSWQL